MRLTAILALLITPLATAANLTSLLESPDGKTKLQLSLVNGTPHWQASTAGTEFLKESPIQIYLGNKANKPLKFKAFDASFKEYNKTWKPTWGQFSSIQNNYKEITWKLSGVGSPETTITVRAYNDAIALRYSLATGGKKAFDRTGLNFAGDYTFWAANGEKPNHGPLKLSAWDKKKLQAPMTIETGSNLYLGVIEAAIYNQYPFSLHKVGKTGYQTRSNPTSWKDNKAQSSWRVITIGKTAGDLITNNTLLNLNPPLQLKDTSWIKTGFTLWDWRSWGATAPDGFVYDLDMTSWKRFIDFAAKHENVKYLMIDANWYGPEFDPANDPKVSRDHLLEQLPDGHIVRKPAPKDWKNPIDMPALIKYGNERGVGIILYINDKARERFDFDETLATYEKWGAAGIKYGFMATNGDKKVLETRYIIEACARHNLICDFHDGPIPGSGDVRAYPNYLTREFCHAQADAKRSFGPKHFVTTVYNNMLTGSLDMANGLYAIKGAEKVRPRIFTKVDTTVVAETARTLINYAALSILPDIPEAYEAKADLFNFIAIMPMNWDETKVLNGTIGKNITMARRAGDTWWIASAIDEKGGSLPIDFSFLPAGSEWEATFYADAADTHYQTNPEAYKITKGSVKAGDKITAKLAPGGGHCILLKKKK